MTTAYSEKLRAPRWQKRRLEILQRDQFMCQKCQDDTSTLHIHHRRYLPNREPWEYPDHDLVTLCERCHADEQECWPEAFRILKGVLCFSGYFAEDVRQLLAAIYEAPGNSRYFLDLISFLSLNEEAYELVSKRFREHVNANRSEAVTPARQASE